MPEMNGQLCFDMYGDLPFGLFVLPDATLRGEAAYIFTKDGDPILEQNADFLRKKKFLKPRILEEHLRTEAPREVDDLVSLTSRCDTGFFHWMMDSLPKVVIAEGCGFTGSYLLPPPANAPWAHETLALLGISPHRVIHHTSLDIYAQRLFVPTYFSGYNAHHNHAFMKLYRDTVRRAIEVKPLRSRERVIIARKPSTKVRRILNYDEVIQAAHAFGFESVTFEDLPLREQLTRALSAEGMIGAHGSGLCHSLFMNEGSTVIELFPFGRTQSCDCYETLSTIPHHRYYSLESGEDRGGDIIVPTSSLRTILTQALS
jgi:capsular polysaccharide biosynthesis protein